MIPEMSETRRTAKRWSLTTLIVIVSVMAVIRAVSVHRRTQGPRPPALQGASLPDAASEGATRFDAAAGIDGGFRSGDAALVFQYAACAGDAIRIDGSNGGGSVVVGDIHSNARRGGEIHIDGASEVYGRVTSAGAVMIGFSESFTAGSFESVTGGAVDALGSRSTGGASVPLGSRSTGTLSSGSSGSPPAGSSDALASGSLTTDSNEATGPTVVYGSVKGDAVAISGGGEVRNFEDLSEWVQGVDLDGDGNLDDLNVTRASANVKATRRILSEDDELMDGDSDRRIANGTQPVEISRTPLSRVATPRMDFRIFYEMTTGIATYPPEGEHVESEIPGDGQGHFFSSASAFLGWINSQQQFDALCWRCAGDGRTDPDNATECPTCEGKGKTLAVEIAGVFYIDGEMLDLSAIETNLIVHGTIVVAEGNPYRSTRTTDHRVRGSMAGDEVYRDAIGAGGGDGSAGAAAIEKTFGVDPLPDKGTLSIGGPTRMNLTQTYRANRDGGTYVWRHRTIHNGRDEQTITVRVPEEGHEMRQFPALVAASDVVVGPRAAGFASYAGDVGDEAVTVIQGVVFAGREIRIGGRGGWHGDPIVFDEEERRSDEDILDEAILRFDLNDDGDVLDLVRISDVSARPVIRVSKGRYNVDINGDGVLGMVTIGEDYGEFFAQNGYTLPILAYHEGTLLGETIRIGAQCAVLSDPMTAQSAPLVGFERGAGVPPAPGAVADAEPRTGRRLVTQQDAKE